MDIKDKIIEEANLHANKGVYLNTNDRQVGLRGYGESSFIAGANFALEEAFRWHDPDKEEPISNPLLLKIEDSRYCDEYRVGWYLEHKYRGWGFYTYPEPDVDFLVTGVAGYRCINLEDLYL